MGGAQESFSDLPILKVRGDHFQIGLQTVGRFYSVLYSVSVADTVLIVCKLLKLLSAVREEMRLLLLILVLKYV